MDGLNCFCSTLGVFDTSFDFAHGVEILVDLVAVGRAQIGGEFFVSSVTKSRMLLRRGGLTGADFGRHAEVFRAEHALEDGAGIGFGRHGRFGRAP